MTEYSNTAAANSFADFAGLEASYAAMVGQLPPVPGDANLIKLPALDLAFDSQFGLAAGGFESALVRLKWGAATASFPPLASDAV